MKGKIVYTTLLAILLIPMSAQLGFAQAWTPPAIPDTHSLLPSLTHNQLGDQVDMQRKAMFHSLARKNGGKGGDRMYDFSGDANLLEKGANSWCPESNPNCGGEGDPEHIVITQDPRQIGSTTSFDATGGLMDVMKAPVYYARVMTTALSSNMAVLNTAWMLTEPAVAGALANSLQVAGGMLEGQYQADSAYMRHLQANPKSAAVTTNIYQACIASKISAVPPRSWLQASAECRGGSRSDSAAGISTWLDTPGITIPPTAAQVTALVPLLTSHPDHLMNVPDNSVMAGALTNDHPFGALTGSTYYDPTDVNNARQISVWDLIFNPAQRNIHYARIPVNAADALHFVKLREAVTDMAGDVFFRIGGDINHLNANELAGAAYGVRKIEIKSKDGDPGRYYKDLVRANYNALTNLMYVRCKYQEFEKKGVVPPEFSLWLSDAVRKSAENFSVVGIQEHPGELEALYQGWFAYAKSRQRILGSTGLGCDDLLAIGVPAAPAPAAAPPWKDGDFDKIMTTGTLNDKPEYVRLFFTVSRRAAYAKVLNIFMEAERTVLALAGGPLDDLARQYGLDRIYQSAGTSNLRDAFDVNIQQFNAFLSAYYKDLSDKVGKSHDFFQRFVTPADGASHAMSAGSRNE